MFHTPAHKQTNPAALPAQIVNPVPQTFEFAVEFGFNFEYFEVTAANRKAARQKLWDEVLTSDQRDNVSDIEFVGLVH